MKKHERECSPIVIERKSIVMVDGKPSRICSGCGTTILYATLKGYEGSCRINTQCRTCGNAKRKSFIVPKDLKRSCPSCQTIIQYKDAKCWRQAERAFRRCKSCADETTRAKTRNDSWRFEHARSLEKAWADPNNSLNSEQYRKKLSEAQRARTDDRSIGAFKAAVTRKKNGQQDLITQASHTLEANTKRSVSHLELRRTNPELWQTDKAKAGWKISGEKGKTYIDKAIRVAQSGNKRSLFERSFDSQLRALGFLPTQQIDRWWVDYLNCKTKVVVECYGDWYHCHPKYDEKIIRLYGGIQPELEMTPVEKRARDEERLRDIENKGYTTIVIWQHDAKQWLSWIENSCTKVINA